MVPGAGGGEEAGAVVASEPEPPVQSGYGQGETVHGDAGACEIG